MGKTVPITDEQFAEINAYLKSGFKDAEVADAVGVSVASITRWRKKGKIVESNKFKPGMFSKSIDMEREKRIEYDPNKRMDGTPILDDHCPAFDDDGRDIPFVEPYIEPKAEPEAMEKKEIPVAPPANTEMFVCINISGQYVSANFDANSGKSYLTICGPKTQGHEVLAGSFGEYLTQIDAIQEELDKVRQLVEKYNI